VVYSLQDDGATPKALRKVGRKLYALKGTTPHAAELEAYAKYLTNERIRAFGIPVPPSISPDLDCLTSTIFFVRKHLPVPYLANAYFPILVSPRDPKIVMVVPSRYWSWRMVLMWMVWRV
jgi:hypothetical protein